MAAKSLKIDSLDLDLENPRIKLATDQRDAMQKIIKEQKFKLINLAESIAQRGFSPMDRCLVMRSPLRSGHFIVLEGNRRVLAAKLLRNPALVIDMEMPREIRLDTNRAKPRWSGLR
jgi:ParB-like chromosome segregation protein Spo0J